MQATGRDTRVFKTLQTVALLDICWFPKKRQEQKSGNKLCLGVFGAWSLSRMSSLVTVGTL